MTWKELKLRTPMKHRRHIETKSCCNKASQIFLITFCRQMNWDSSNLWSWLLQMRLLTFNQKSSKKRRKPSLGVSSTYIINPVLVYSQNDMEISESRFMYSQSSCQCGSSSFRYQDHWTCWIYRHQALQLNSHPATLEEDSKSRIIFQIEDNFVETLIIKVSKNNVVICNCSQEKIIGIGQLLLRHENHSFLYISII